MANLYSLLKQVSDSNGTVILLNDNDICYLHKRLLAIIDDIVNVCEKYSINYQLSGGSALGAIRHQGFIPWDDDIDINMTRNELERFIPIFTKEYSKKYWIHVPGETEGFDFSVVHILAKDIRARGLMHADKEECGIGVDIFTIENTFNNRLLRQIQGVGSLGFRYALSCLRIRDNIQELDKIADGNDELMKYIHKRNRIASLLAVIPKKTWIKMSNSWAKICKNETSTIVSIPSGQKMFFKEQYLRKDFLKSIKMPFEGRMLNVTADYDNYLKLLYGDYMVLPPEEKREKHVMVELDRDALYGWNEH